MASGDQAANIINLPTSKTCSKCGQSKDINQFYRLSSSPTGRNPQCKACYRQNGLRHYQRHRTKLIKQASVDNRRRKYGVTQEIFEALLAAQSYQCAICAVQLTSDRFSLRPQIDHCHATGKVRGILCSKCNTALGSFGDQEEILLKAVQYLIKYRNK